MSQQESIAMNPLESKETKQKDKPKTLANLLSQDNVKK